MTRLVESWWGVIAEPQMHTHSLSLLLSIMRDSYSFYSFKRPFLCSYYVVQGIQQLSKKSTPALPYLLLLAVVRTDLLNPVPQFWQVQLLKSGTCAHLIDLCCHTTLNDDLLDISKEKRHKHITQPPPHNSFTPIGKRVPSQFTIVNIKPLEIFKKLHKKYGLLIAKSLFNTAKKPLNLITVTGISSCSRERQVALSISLSFLNRNG